MKTLALLCLTLLFSGSAIAEAPAWANDVSKAISQAGKEKKLGFILMGREACGNCQATRKLVNEGTVPVTAEEGKIRRHAALCGHHGFTGQGSGKLQWLQGRCDADGDDRGSEEKGRSCREVMLRSGIGPGESAPAL